nr:alpha-hydroxy acid oxidase [Rhodococcus pseudokoreensis]
MRTAALSAWSDDVSAVIEDGAGAGRAIAANRAAHERWALRSRVLVDVSEIDTTTEILGRSVSSPVLVAPSGGHTLVHPGGEVATARGVRDADSIMVLSSATGRTLPDVRAVGGRTWFQLYFGTDRDLVQRVVSLAAEQGCEALCLTADMPVPPLHHDGMRRGMASIAGRDRLYLPQPGGSDLPHDPRLTWSDLDWLREVSDLPLVLKGIMHPDDAIRAAECGVDAIVVSNHGGRALDTAWGTLDALPEIVDALSGYPTEVYVDGGFRHGREVAVALSLGARAVFVGRPALWALTLDGAHGVTDLLELLRRQLARTMAMIGATSIADLDTSRIRRIAD